MLGCAPNLQLREEKKNNNKPPLAYGPLKFPMNYHVGRNRNVSVSSLTFLPNTSKKLPHEHTAGSPAPNLGSYTLVGANRPCRLYASHLARLPRPGNGPPPTEIYVRTYYAKSPLPGLRPSIT